MGNRLAKALAVALTACLLIPSSLWAAPSNSNQISKSYVDRSGHRYVKRGDTWFVAQESGTEIEANINRIVIRVATGWSPDAIPSTGMRAPATVGNVLKGNYVAITIPKGADPFDYMGRIEAVPGVEWARFEYIGHFDSDDPYFGQQWGLTMANVPEAWAYTTGDPSISVGIIDSPLDAGHPDLPTITSLGGQTGNPFYHGTGVAGIAVARIDNGVGMAGIAGDVTVYNYGLPTGDFGMAEFGESDVANAITMMANQGVDVINMSIGFGDPNANHFPVAVAAIDDAVDNHDMVIVCATGNNDDGVARVDFPASYSKTIAVSAIDENGDVHGQVGSVDVVAPGWLNILTTDVRGCPCADPFSCTEWTGGLDEGDYMCVLDDPSCDNCYSNELYCDTCATTCPTCFGGTSAAAPFVTGVAALIRSANPALTWTEVRDILRWTADKLPDMNGLDWTKKDGYGLVNTGLAVRAALAIPQDGIITTNTTWPPKVVPGRDIEVAEGATLTIEAGTEIYCGLTDAQNLEPFFEDQVELHVRGSMVVNGTANDPVLFRSATKTPAEGDWVHIDVLASGSLTMNHAEVQNSTYGVDVSTSGAVSVSNSVFDGNSSDDFHLLGSGSTLIDGCQIDVGGGTGIDVSTSNVTISSTTITGDGTSGYGIRFSSAGASATIDHNTISGFTNSSAGYGISLDFGTSTITSNTIYNCYRGISIARGTHQIGLSGGGNDISGCTTAGIYATCTAPGACPASCDLDVTIRHNSIHDNHVGVTVRKTQSGVDLGTAADLGYNSFLNNGLYCLNNTSSCGTVSAEGNYFGTCNPIPPICFNGDFDVANYLCSPPSMAPIAPPSSQSPELAPGKTALLGNSPNPFNPITTIQYSLAETLPVKLSIFDVSGRRVRQEDMGQMTAGLHEWTWDGHDAAGRSLSSGVYFVRLEAGRTVATQKILMLK